jgi:prephenate dehydrogenase
MTQGTPPAASTGDRDAEPPFRTIAIVGVGLIGGSIGLAAHARWPGVRVIGIDRRDVLASALAFGAVSETASAPDAALHADLVILCAPVAVNLATLEAIAPRLRPEVVVTDVGSTKREIVALAEARELAGFVGGHPLAGAATSGTSSAREQLFRGRPWILTPGLHSATPAVERLRAFARGLGATPTVLHAEEHDRLMAFVSHLPQVVASTLLHTIGGAVGDAGLALSGPGLADTTRLASSPGTLWAGILGANADHVGTAIGMLESALAEMRSGLRDPSVVERTFASAARWRGGIKLIGDATSGRRSTDGPGEAATVPAIRTYLEQTSRPRPIEEAWPNGGWQVNRVTSCPPSLFRYLYREVGRRWHWVDRLPWTNQRIREHLATPGVEVWVVSTDGVPAGYFELARNHDGVVEIAYFGLLPEFIGRGAGRSLLNAAINRAWDWRGTTIRVWLHTCSLDHPRALPNYLAAGFRVVREESYVARLDTPAGEP